MVSQKSLVKASVKEFNRLKLNIKLATGRDDRKIAKLDKSARIIIQTKFETKFTVISPEELNVKIRALDQLASFIESNHHVRPFKTNVL
jgi:hypothetical protein